MLVSPRNSDKKSLSIDDMVLVFKDDDKIFYSGERKPSIDTPIQIEIYNMFPDIKYLIHGHSFSKIGEYTENYCLCGDLNEIYEIKPIIEKNYNKSWDIINLKNHGFFIWIKDIKEFEKFNYDNNFYYREII